MIHSMQTLMIASIKKLPNHILLVNLPLFIANCGKKYFSIMTGSVSFKHICFPNIMQKKTGLERKLEKVTVDCQAGQLIEGVTHLHRTNTPANIYLFKVNNRNIGIILMFLMLTWNIFHTFFSVSTLHSEKLNVKGQLQWTYCSQLTKNKHLQKDF